MEVISEILSGSPTGDSEQYRVWLEEKLSELQRAIHYLQVAIPNESITLAAGVTTFNVSKNFHTITGDALGNTIGTITGGYNGQVVNLLFVDALVTITDTDAATENTVNLSAAFTSSANDVMTLIHNGTKWFEIGRSVN